MRFVLWSRVSLPYSSRDRREKRERERGGGGSRGRKSSDREQWLLNIDHRRLKEHRETIRLAASRWPSENTWAIAKARTFPTVTVSLADCQMCVQAWDFVVRVQLKHYTVECYRTFIPTRQTLSTLEFIDAKMLQYHIDCNAAVLTVGLFCRVYIQGE